MVENSEDLFYLVVGIAFAVMAISWICFARLTMARIERESLLLWLWQTNNG